MIPKQYNLLMESIYIDSRKSVFDFNFNDAVIDFFYQPIRSSSTFVEKNNKDEIYDLDLRSENKKIIILDKISLYHLFAEILPSIIDILENYSDIEIFFNVFENKKQNEKTYLFLIKIIEYINSIYDSKIFVIDSNKDISILINNYYFLDSINHIPEQESITKFQKILKSFIGVTDQPNNKKIYLSRSQVFAAIDEESIGQRFSTAKRIINEEKLENFFKNHGYEIINPENFNSMQEQQLFMNQVNTLVSATSSGIGNAISMLPGTAVLEISTPISFADEYLGKRYYREVFHNQYGPYCFMLNINYARLPNVDRQADSIINAIKSSKSLQGFLQIEVNNDKDNSTQG